MILRLRELGVLDHRLLSVFEEVPRQNFVPVIYLDEAYNRGLFPIECGQTMTSVDDVALALHSTEHSQECKNFGIGNRHWVSNDIACPALVLK